MTILQKNKAINDNTKLVRFLDLYGAEKSIGAMDHGEINFTYHYGSLNYYQTLETNAGDSKEGSTSINLGKGIIGSDTTGNSAIVSCWSIWDGQGELWQAFTGSSFTQNQKNICAVVSTVGKVKRIFEQVAELNQMLLGHNLQHIVLRAEHGPVIYYPRDSGVSHEYWEDINDPVKYGLAARTVHNIFHKRDCNDRGQRYDTEQEYRFAMVMGMRRFFGSDTKIALSAKDAILRDYPLILKDGVHYIEEVHLRTEHPDIEATCYFANINLAKYG
jgi:hypothetical protein